MARKRAPGEKTLDWIGSSKKDFLAFPRPVVEEMGTALSVAQFGGRHPSVKPWKGLGPGVQEIVENFDGNTYRAVFTVRFPDRIYVLHAFQKKSPKGVKTPKTDIDLVRNRLKVSARDNEQRTGKSRK